MKRTIVITVGLLCQMLSKAGAIEDFCHIKNNGPEVVQSGERPREHIAKRPNLELDGYDFGVDEQGKPTLIPRYRVSSGNK
jgi:hypothetical protein